MSAFAERPARGWVRAIRDALGMSSRQLAARINISQPAVAQLERSEADGVAQLDTLRRAADALECDLVYVLVPRASLAEIVRNRARAVARADIATVDRTMRLEEQGLTPDQLERRIYDYAAKLITTGRLWDEPEQLVVATDNDPLRPRRSTRWRAGGRSTYHGGSTTSSYTPYRPTKTSNVKVSPMQNGERSRTMCICHSSPTYRWIWADGVCAPAGAAPPSTASTDESMAAANKTGAYAAAGLNADW